MRSFQLFLLALSVVAVKADLTCLEWSVFSPLVGLVCAFRPTVVKAADQAIFKGVEDTAATFKRLVQFDLTHNPAYLIYNYGSLARQKGLPEANKAFVEAIQDAGSVTIGFGKETSNQLVQVYELADWNDVTFCLMAGAAKLVPLSTISRRALLPPVDDVKALTSRCLKNHFASPLTFNITGPNQKVGASISDIASFFVPVAPEAKAGAAAAEGAFDLVIPGSEQTARVFKKVGKENVAQHFASEEEARIVAKKMKEDKFRDDFCAVCAVPADAVVAKRLRRSTFRNGLFERAGIPDLAKSFGACCKIPSEPVALERPDNEITADPNVGAPVYEIEPGEVVQWKEADLGQAPKFKVHDIGNPVETQALRHDLDTLNTGVVAADEAMTNIMTSEDALAIYRKICEGDKADPLYKALNIQDRTGALIATFDQIDKGVVALKPLMDWAAALSEHSFDVVRKMRLFDNKPPFTDLKTSIEFHYIGAAEKAMTGIDPRGFHTDKGIMAFSVFDTPGLVVENRVGRTISRVPVQRNSFYVLKALFWDPMAWLKGTANCATPHAVFGPEMAAKGRVSIVLTVYNKATIPF